MRWQELAACRDMDTDLFFVAGGRGGRVSQAAVDACERCPVRQECLDDAIAHGDLGYRGGYSKKGREKLTGRRISGPWFDVGLVASV